MSFTGCFQKSPLILTEGAVGLRVSHEFGIAPDRCVMYAGLIYDADGRRVLGEIYGQYLQTAQDFSLPILLMTNTSRAHKERVSASIYKDKNVMSDYAYFLRETAAKYRCETYIGGFMGCKGDGYTGAGCLSREESELFHSWQTDAFERSGVDFIYPTLMPALEETVGMAAAIQKSPLPYIISFMVRENGALPDGTAIHDAIRAVDASAVKKPLCYTANCVHPRILLNALRKNDTALVRSRFMGIRANAAYLPGEELDKSSETLTSDARELAAEMAALAREFPMKIRGGCCGTDGSHIREFAGRPGGV